jgi:hypothetical protein
VIATLREVARFLLARRALWLVPIVVALALVAALVTVSVASPLLPFIYPGF